MGGRSLRIVPELNWELRELKASYDSPAGAYQVHWRIPDLNHVEMSVQVPFGCQASLVLPFARPETFKNHENPIFADVRDDMCLLTAGTYHVVYETVKPLGMEYSVDTPIKELLANWRIKERLSMVLPLSQLPEKYHEMSLRQAAAAFGGRMGEEQLEQIDRMLRSL